MKVPAYATHGPGEPLGPFEIERRELRPDDVAIEILYCGICHSDIHQARDEWGGSVFPMVPGHEIVGTVVEVGAKVEKLKPGDLAGVGCFVDSCLACEPCKQGFEQFCEQGAAFTYNATEMDRETLTYGGYSRRIVVREHFVLAIPPGLDPARAAPLLCAGITTYSPLVQWKPKPGDRVAVVGLGGLGHLAVKLASAMGAEVAVLSTSRRKEADARRLGASSFEVTSEKGTFETLQRRFDLILDTVSASHDFNSYLRLLRPYGTMVVLGIPPEPAGIEPFALLEGNRRLAGSSMGGIRETQRMLEFCAERGIGADVEVIPIQAVNTAYDRVVRGDVRYRFVIDMATLAG